MTATMSNRPAYELDIENLVGFFEIKLKHRDSGTIMGFPMYAGSPPLDRETICYILSQVTIYTFNGNNYDVPILVLALAGADNATLKQAGDRIILQGLKPWEFYREYQIDPPEYMDHVDVMEVAAGVRIGLKMYGGRMHAPTMQDLPVDPNIPVPPTMFEKISKYCDNDLELTGLMREGLVDRLALRAAIGERYGIDVRSRSDAQIAEAVIKSQLAFRPEKRYIPHGYEFAYQPPTYLRFVTPELQQLLEDVRCSMFFVSKKEEAIALGIENVTRTGVQIPEIIKGRDIVIGSGKYRIGIGGLHSQESAQFLQASDSQAIVDIDVVSYYPSLILGGGMYPTQIGPAFLTIYQKVYERRLFCKEEAKRIKALYDGMGAPELKKEYEDYQTESDGLKIVLNGTFGKLFSQYSILYAPEFGIATTMTGQLSLLMLIEMMELSGIRVVSANTDGIVLVIPKGLEWAAQNNVKWWERETKLEMEESRYKLLASRDVNNYVAIDLKGKTKRKGIFRASGLIDNKHPDKDICSEAVVAYLSEGVPIEKTIRECRDIRKFIVVRAVQGGGHYVPEGGGEPVYLGKAVRWYYGRTLGHIAYVSSGNQVAGSMGATPAMTLPETFPDDVDYDNYIDTARKALQGMGVMYGGS